MNDLTLDFHGWTMRLRGDPATLEDLHRDFAAFECPGTQTHQEELELIAETAPAGLETGLPLWSGRRYSIRICGRERRVFYRPKIDAPYDAVAAIDFSSHQGRIWCADPVRLRELGYLAVLSRAGEELDAMGLHRAHALGFEWKGSAGLIFAPSSGGKSELALALLRDTTAGLLSDETPLLDSKATARAFALRLGFRASADLSDVPERWIRHLIRRDYESKRVVDYDFFRDRVRDALPVRWVFVANKDAGIPRFYPASLLSTAAALGTSLVVGHGVAQMAEYRLRPTALAPLTLSALGRAAAACALLRRASLWNFTLGSDPRRAAAALVKFLDGSEPAQGRP
ncbi:MAG: hypothetical protein AAB036_06275 [Elusimicrobiota bacterium]